jgi:hemolysin activation/secretion protein
MCPIDNGFSPARPWVFAVVATGCGLLCATSEVAWRGTLGIVFLLFLMAKASALNDAVSSDHSPGNSSGASAQAVQAATQPTFFVKRYQIKGASGILSRGEIEEAVYPFMGPERTAGDVEQACGALERVYQEKGYQTIAVQVPAQAREQVARGLVVLEVVEERIGRLRVNGARYFLPSQIKREAPSLAEGSFPNFNDVSRDIVGLNQQADRRVTPTIHASETPGMVDVDLNVKDSPPLHGSIELDNRYSANTTRLRANANVSYDNLWQLGHSVTFTYQVAPENPHDAQVFSGSYLARIPNVPWLSFLVSGLKSDSNVATVGSINVASRGDQVGIRAVMTLPTLRETGFYHTFSFGIDYKNYDEALNSGAGAISDTPIVYYPFTATYSGTLQDKASTTQFNAGVVFGVDGMGSAPATFDAKGFGTAANFIYFRGNLARTQELPLGLQGYANVQVQWADEPLVNTEQVSAGGLDTVRGYLESEALGDNGAQGQFELRSPSLSKWLGKSVDEWRFYTFGDAAWLTVNKPLPEVQSDFQLASCGVGTRLKLIDDLTGSLDVAFPLLAGPDTKDCTPMLTFQVSAAY